MNYILRLEDRNAEATLGGKAKAIAQLQRVGFLVPQWFVVPTIAWFDSLTPEQHKIWRTVKDEAEIAALLSSIQINPTVEQQIIAALTQLCPQGELVAVRSSASEEDGGENSFAGQFDSFLNVHPLDVPKQIIAVWQSSLGQPVLNYRQQQGLPRITHPPAVLIQRMVHPQAAGVAFAADPVTGRRGVTVVSAVAGLGNQLVSGKSDGDNYYIDKNSQISKHQVNCQPILEEKQIQAIAGMVRQASKYFARPQDIEWAIEGEQLYLLQSRPITALTQISDPDGLVNLWDNSNIVESYSGVTTPLTFSFARQAYEEVYRQFCRVMGVSQTTIEHHRDTFSCMIGLIRGRIYYNLLSWYRVLALLPGFKVNRRFMEQMMGVRESLPESIISELQNTTWQNRLQDIWQLLGTVGGLVANYFLLGNKIKRFYARLDKVLYQSSIDFENCRADELATYYRNIENQLLTHWDAPLINDFFAMIFYGVLKQLTQKWCGDESGTMQNDLISGEGGIISAEPAQKIMEMANLCSQDSEFVDLLCYGSLEKILHSITQKPQFQSEYYKYLEEFGERCLDELKLESPTLHDNPLPLLRAVGQLSPSPQLPKLHSEPRKTAEQKVRDSLKFQPLKQFIFNWVLNNARNRVRDRENLRFERTRVFGRARRLFVELGRQFYALDLLNSPKDIFYLEVNEILGFITGTTTCTNLKGLVAIRQREFSHYQEMTPPDSRFETYGIVHQGNPFEQKSAKPNPEFIDQQQGTGCSPGIVRGKVRVICDPQKVIGTENNSPLLPGTILVAERTDPGWILLFPAAAGLLVERGSLLSHAAIVAREISMPAIVSLPGITKWLKDGDWIEMDGATGRVYKING